MECGELTQAPSPGEQAAKKNRPSKADAGAQPTKAKENSTPRGKGPPKGNAQAPQQHKPSPAAKRKAPAAAAADDVEDEICLEQPAQQPATKQAKRPRAARAKARYVIDSDDGSDDDGDGDSVVVCGAPPLPAGLEWGL
jgi:hypothetical protein